MSYKLEFSEDALSKLEDLAKADAKRLRQVLIKAISLRKNPYPQDSEKLKNFEYMGLKGLRVNQGEYRVVYAVDEAKRRVLIGLILDRSKDYRELDR